MKPQIGTISHGTLRTEDLIPTFLETLKGLDNLSDEHISLVDRISNWIAHLRPDYPSNIFWTGEAIFDLEDLAEALDDYSPSNCYFGAHIGDGSDFGWWSTEEEFSLEALEEIP